jgi:hypothetical protein
VQHGIDEGRRASLRFWSVSYLAQYPDLVTAFGSRGYRLAAQHFVAGGAHQELRVGAFEADERLYAPWVYRKLNTDLATYDDAQLAAHWLQHGLAEGRQANIGFWVGDYVARNPDVAQAWPNDPVGAARHYVLVGVNQGRPAVTLADPLVYDAAAYAALNADLAATRADPAALGVHWLLHGIAEGRQAQPTFSSVNYRARYPDVAAATAPGDWAAVIRHYVLVGSAQGRDGH